MLPACQATLGSLLVKVSLAGDTTTACFTVSVGHGRPPVAVKRRGKDQFQIGVSEDADLTGELQVVVQRFATDQCTIPLGPPVSQAAKLTRGQQAVLEFSFTMDADAGLPDAGVDGGVDAGADAGVDAGCDLSACAAVPLCGQGSAMCLPDGGCGFELRDAGSCGDGGVCDARGRCAPACEVLPDGRACDDRLGCTTGDACLGGTCLGNCTNHSVCAMEAPACEADGGCHVVPFPDGTGCLVSPPKQCLTGQCVPSLGFVSATLGSSVAAFPYPSGGWVVSAGCEVTVDTSLDPPQPVDGGWCGQAPASALRTRPDAGPWAVLAMTALEVGADAAVHFVGPNPVALVVLGDATVNGLLSVAPTGPGTPAGANQAECASHNAGLEASNALGGGGAGFGATGGRGGRDGGLAGVASGVGTDLLVPLRGGCRGGATGTGKGGSGGGALQLTVAGTLTIAANGLVSASGQGGQGSGALEGAAGGGSGGALLLEAKRLTLTGFVSANGGAGGESGGPKGADGALSGSTPASGGTGWGHGGVGGVSGAPVGAPGDEGITAGGGGGGSVGRVRIRTADAGCGLVPTNTSGSVRADCL